MDLKEAIKALNNGHEVTHDFLDGYSLIKMTDKEVVHSIDHGWNDMIDPLHKGDTYYQEYICSVYVLKDGDIVDCNPRYIWKNDSEYRYFPVNGWRIVEPTEEDKFREVVNYSVEIDRLEKRKESKK